MTRSTWFQCALLAVTFMVVAACGSTRTLPPASTPEPIISASGAEPAATVTPESSEPVATAAAEPAATVAAPDPTATVVPPATEPAATVASEGTDAAAATVEPEPTATAEPEPTATVEPVATAVAAGPASGTERCLVYLHGKGGAGGDTALRGDGLVAVSPSGNGTGWGALQWEYDSAAKLEQATASIVASINAADCGRVVIHGFSNGASMAAALHCSGNDLGGRLQGVVIDDPVPDAATMGCTPATDRVALYWTGALAIAAPAGTNCVQIDWTCAGDVLREIDAYAADLGAPVTASPHSNHQWNFQTDLPALWLG